MLNFPFKNYAEFQNLFGIVEHGNGVKSRKNRILLAYYKSKEIRHYALSGMHNELLEITDMAQLKTVLLGRIKLQQFPRKYKVQLINDVFKSDIYETDELKGVCEDGDCKCVRYIKHEGKKTKPYKMRAGKFLKAIIEETELGKILPEQVKIWLMEEFSMDFQTYAMGRLPKNKLFVNKSFGRIYDSEALKGDFESCMVNKGYHSFYKDEVDASAAYLENEEGLIIARCIIFNNVRDDDTGKIWRLAERQYSTGSNDILKRALVDSLIKGGYIDGYKRVGAGCRDTNAFVDNEGRSLSSCRFSIECTADLDSIYSFQDSFAYLSTDKQRAYNYDDACWNYQLDDTTGYVGDDGDNDDDRDEWDSYHERYAYEVYTVYVHGEEMTCDVDDMDDFIRVDDEWYHEDDVFRCPECDEKFVANDGVHSDITDETYCCASCCDVAEDNYKKENWFWSEYDQKYYEDEDEIKTFNHWDSDAGEYIETTIYDETYDELVRTEMLWEYGDEAFDEINPSTNLPYGYQLVKTSEYEDISRIALLNVKSVANETLKEAV